MADTLHNPERQDHVDRVRRAIGNLLGVTEELPEGLGRFLVTTSRDAATSGSMRNASAPANNVLRSISDDPALQTMLLQRREQVQRAIDAVGAFDEAAIVRHQNDAGRWKIICRDASDPGKWRTQSFDLKGFSGHVTFDRREQAIEDAATSGFTVRDDRALDRIQDTPAFQRGLFAADLVRKINAGELSFLAANEELAGYDRVAGVLASIAVARAQAYYEPASNTIVFLADRIASGHERGVFLHEIMHKHGRAVLGGARWNRLSDQVLEWARAPLGSLERTIHDAAFVRVIGAVGPGDREAFREEMLAYAVEEAVRRGVKPSARSRVGSAASWLAQVVSTLRNLVQRLSGSVDAAKAIGVQEAVDLAYALAQLENPDRARQIRQEMGPDLAKQLQREIRRLPAHDALRRSALAHSLAGQDAELARAVADLAERGESGDPELAVRDARAQCARVGAQHLGRDTWMRAPNGAPTKLSAAQWVMVRTENFKRWFGDWESDPNGSSFALDPLTREPRVLYHGAPKGGFAEFNPQSTENGAMFFSADPCVAATYSGSLEEVEVSDPDEFGEFETMGGIYPVFLNIRRPKFEDFEGASWSGERHDQWELVDENADPLDVDGRTIFDRAQVESLEREHPDLELVPAPDFWGSTTDVVDDARRSNCDGAILCDVVDEGRFGGGYSDPSDVYVVFSGRQVKSATLNVGTFDDGWDIRYSERASTHAGGPGARTRFSFLGEKAQTADRFRLRRAQSRVDDGEDAEAVRRDTGWSRGLDGKWRCEISDASARLKMEDLSWGEAEDLKRGNSTGLPLGRLLEHAALFAAYPALQELWVRLIPGRVGASFVQSENVITIGYDRNSATADLSGLLHEIQHAIQATEGFAAGGSPSQFQLKRSAALPLEEVSAALDIQEFAGTHGLTIKQVRASPPPFLRNRSDAAWYLANSRDKASLVAEHEFARQANEPFESYMRLAGEVEARNTQARQAMTDAERLATAPAATADVAESDVIALFNGKEMMNASQPANAGPLDQLQALIEEADGNIREVDLRARVQYLARSVEVFASEHAVHAALRPWDPMGSVTGVELTDLYANEPGAGQGALVMRHLTRLAQDLGVVVYLRADGPRSREFYARAGFVPVPSRSCGGAGGFLAWYPPVQDEDDGEHERRSLRERGK